MILKDVYERFSNKTPVSVMVRATIENVLASLADRNGGSEAGVVVQRDSATRLGGFASA